MAQKQESKGSVRDRMILSEDLSKVEVPTHEILDSLKDDQTVIYHDGLLDHLFRWSKKADCSLHIATYSWSWGLYNRIQPARFIMGTHFLSRVPDHHIRYCTQNHAKMYLFYAGPTMDFAIVGSSNLTGSGMFNLNIKVTSALVLKTLERTYNTLWNTSRPIVPNSSSPSASLSMKSSSATDISVPLTSTPITPRLEDLFEPGIKFLPGTKP